jgi:hypothetical protein
MRAELVFGATKYVSDGNLLARLAAKAIRAFNDDQERHAS